jgi:hypothetical protein
LRRGGAEAGLESFRGIAGSGEAGKVSGSRDKRDHNNLLTIALDEGPMTRLAEAVKALHSRLDEENPRVKVPLKAFMQPCELVV